MKTNIISEDILTLEELSLNSWPALQEIHHRGWIIRLADEYSRRSNSVWPLYGSSNDLEEKVRKCESIYRAHHQRSFFRMTSDESMSDLDLLLERLGYERVTTVIVQTLDISDFQDDSDNSEIILSHKLTDSWSDSVAEFVGLGDGKAAYHAILNNITFPIGLVSVKHDGM
ncbi:MAG: hypothetical protein JSU74_01235, partial [Candidatus Zixiibacteriota bacterium]